MSIVAQAKDVVIVRRYTKGVVGPSLAMDEVVKDGGRITTVAPPGCWGPMITPSFEGGHEVSWPVAVEGAHIGDAIAITIERVLVLSTATSSGTMVTKKKAFGSDPFVDKICPGCHTPWPPYRVEGTGEGAVRCAKCGAEASPFGFEEGYTLAFNDERTLGVTVDSKTAHDFATRARQVAALPENSEQVPILIFEPHTIPGTLVRLQSFVGNIGTIPSKDMPDSHNAGDFGSFLIGANHKFRMTPEELKVHRTDGHLDCNSVREGAVLIVPVKVEGGGIYIGDAHANQGDGELALHTTDITADIQVRVNVIKGLNLEGPILLPNVEDLPWIARPFSSEEIKQGKALAATYKVQPEADVAPVQFLGTAATINEAADNAIDRAAALLQMSKAEVRNRSTISGAVEIARFPGAVQLTMLVPRKDLEVVGIGELVKTHYQMRG